MINLSLRISAMLCVEFPQMQWIDLSELIHVLKAVTIVTREPLLYIDDFCSQSLLTHF